VISTCVKRATGVLALVAALALPAAALGKTHKLSGTVGGDPASTVSMKVVVKKGNPKKVKAFAWSGLNGFCSGVPAGEQSGTTGLKTSAFPSPFRVFGSYDGAGGPGDVVDISGTVKKKGKKVVDGLIVVSFNDGFCSAPPLPSRSFTATK